MSPARIPRSSASCGWISSRSSLCHKTLGVRRVWAPTLYWERRSEEHTSELQSLMRISYAVFCLKKKKIKIKSIKQITEHTISETNKNGITNNTLDYTETHVTLN